MLTDQKGRGIFVLVMLIYLTGGCSYKNTALEPYEPVPVSCEEIRAEMKNIADEVGDTWVLRDVRDGLQIGLNIAIVASWISPEFAVFNIALQGIPTKDQSKLIRLNFLGHAYENRGCWGSGSVSEQTE